MIADDDYRAKEDRLPPAMRSPLTRAKELATCERMWDGCGCKIDYFS